MQRRVTFGVPEKYNRNGLRVCLFIVMTVVVMTELVVAEVAKADELADFESARGAYESGEYALAATRFESLVGGEIPALSSEVLIAEARKYFAAALIFEGDNERARRQFRFLLQAEPDYELDPLAFPEAVHTLFSQVRETLRNEEAARNETQRLEEERRTQETLNRLLEQEERLLRLEQLAMEVEVERRGSRWLAALPFGVGQFQNGHRGLGLALLTSQIFFATTSLATFAYHQFLENQLEPGSEARLIDVGRAIRIVNWTSVGLFAGLAIAGIIDAQVRFRPVERTVRRRPLPDDLIEPRLEQSTFLEDVETENRTEFELGLGLTGMNLRLRF